MRGVRNKSAMDTMPPAQSQPLDADQIVAQLNLRPGMHVGDFGTDGTAFFSSLMAKAVGPDGQVLLFDVVKAQLSAAMSALKAKRLTNYKAVWTNLELYEGARGVGQNSLNAGLAVNLLSQTKKYKDVLTEIHRMLQPGGRLVIVDWQPGASARTVPSPDMCVSAERIQSVAQSIGFAPSQEFAPTNQEWGLVLIKT